MTESKLAACRQPQRNLFEAAADGQCVVFAVAHRHGAEQNHDERTERAAHRVLYLTADGERAIEDSVTAAVDDLSRVDRAKMVPESMLEAAGEAAKRFGPIVQRHPEV